MQLYQRSRAGFTLIEIMVVLAILGLLLAMAIPNFIRTRRDAQRHLCKENLTQIESAKQIWGLDKNKRDADIPTETDLVGSDAYIKSTPLCPGAGTYTYGAIGGKASCTIEGHTL